jgi:hypothetical protein
VPHVTTPGTPKIRSIAGVGRDLATFLPRDHALLKGTLSGVVMNRNGRPSAEGNPDRPKFQRGGSFLPAWAFSVAAHVMVVGALVWAYAVLSPPDPEPSPILVSLVEAPEPEPPGPPDPAPLEGGAPQDPAPPAAPELTAPEPVPAATEVPAPEVSDLPAPTPAPVEVAAAAPMPDNFSDLLSESQLVGAPSVDGGVGSGGGGCDTARALQRDPLVRKAVADAQRAGKAIMLWNGDWVRSGAQDGKGLSGVREAIMWVVAFAPEACRKQRVKGLVLLSLADGTRFGIGADDWRWSDLLGVPQASAER